MNEIAIEVLKLILKILVGLVAALIIATGIYIYRNLNYDRNIDKTITHAGFFEKQTILPDGTLLNYGEGPDNGPSLLLIHGQSTDWKNYSKVLPVLSKHYHVFAIDCHGHGKSSKNAAKYNAESMGNDFIWFIENVINEPAIVSGHSSGGLLTAWLAANSPENVSGIVIEDAPFFSTEPDRYEKTFAWVDNFNNIHQFLNQTDETDFMRFYLDNCYFKKFFGDGWEGIKNYAFGYMEKHPDKKLRIFLLPPSINKACDLFTGTYDLRFGDTCYDYSWFKNFNQEEILRRIKCPSVLIHTNWSYSDDGILLAAMSGEDAERAHSLINNNALIRIKSGHNSHDEKPKEFSKILLDFLR
jgi:pimeloyl-ACP methyl ester carboxylesterase